MNDSHRWGNGGIAFPVLADKFSIVSDTEGNTIPGRTDNGALIDYILFKDYKDSGIKIVETHIVRTLKVNGSVIDLGSISDHYPVYVDIEIPGRFGSVLLMRPVAVMVWLNVEWILPSFPITACRPSAYVDFSLASWRYSRISATSL